jgi:superoxide reductase
MAVTAQAATKCEEDLFCGVNTAKDPKNMTDLEKKHVPVISAPARVKKGEKFEVTIEVGKLMAHPNEPGHYIDFIELYADHTYLARVDFTARNTWPTAKLTLSLDHIHKKLRAYEHCNLHGVWEGDCEIEVTG